MDNPVDTTETQEITETPADTTETQESVETPETVETKTETQDTPDIKDEETPHKEEAKEADTDEDESALTAKDEEITDLTGKLTKAEEKVSTLKGQVKSLSAVVDQVLDGKLKAVPKEYVSLIPEGDAVAKLAWINKAEATGIFNKVEPKEDIEIGKPLEIKQDQKGTSTLSPHQALSNFFGAHFNKN